MKTPYFINPAIDALDAATPEERKQLTRRIAACVGDETALRAIIGIDPRDFASFYPDMTPPKLNTDDTIDSFISRFSSEKQAETPEIDQLVPVAPAIDYAAMLEQEAGDGQPERPTDETDDLIASFLQAVPPKKPTPRSKPLSPKDNSQPTENPQPQDQGLSEELFKLMVRNKNYAKALEIITELSLNNPKKSIYFAYQIRFLKNLMKNEAKTANSSRTNPSSDNGEIQTHRN